MTEEQLHVRDKIVQQMSRQGLTEENVTQETVKNISQRQEEINYSASTEPLEAHDRAQSREYFSSAAKEAGEHVPSENKPPVPAEETEEAVEDMLSLPAEEFASLANKTFHVNKETDIEDETAGIAGKLLKEKTRKQKSEIRQRTEHLRKRLQYKDSDSDEDDSPEEEEQQEEEQREKERSEKEAIVGKRLKTEKKSQLNFEKDDKEETEKEKSQISKISKRKNTLNTLSRLNFEEEDTKDEEESETDKEKHAMSHPSEKKKTDLEKERQRSGRLQFEEDKGKEEEGGEEGFVYKNFSSDRFRNGILRRLQSEAEQEQEKELDFEAQITVKYLHETKLAAGLVKGGRRLERLRQETRTVENEQHIKRSEKLKEGSRYLKESETANMKKEYQKKHHQQKAIENVQRVMKNTENAVKAKKVLQAVAALVKKGVLVGVSIILLVLLLFFGLGYLVFNLLYEGGAGAGAFYSGLYQSTYSDISDCEAYFRKLETDLEEEIANIKEDYPDYYEYIYDLGDVGHKAVDLISYLSTKYTDFTLEMCRNELETLFEKMYTLTVEIEEEPRERQKTDEDGNGIYDEEGNSVIEIFMAKICYITLKVKPWNEIVEECLTEKEKSRYDLYVLSQGAQQVYGNPLAEDWKDKISSRFGYRIHPITKEKTFHSGLDIAVPVGTPLYSCTAGIVTVARYSETAGNFIVVLMESGYSVTYMHLDSLGVSPGEEITKGMLIGSTGNTGRSTGPHLHVEVRTPDDKPIDPTFIITSGAAPEKGEK